VSPNAPLLISVIVPAYQAESFLTRALDSVVTQTDPDW
jgi:glycosyltransferase involved in cell wall biosynthesis